MQLVGIIDFNENTLFQNYYSKINSIIQNASNIYFKNDKNSNFFRYETKMILELNKNKLILMEKSSLNRIYSKLIFDICAWCVKDNDRYFFLN